ncbi:MULTISPECIES: LysR family transcriptional regulator [Pseudomonas]|uniref:LysR family transcriptional regulator n=1 Tax=Pseudomonas taiwanensis TaxID=470150 RepID=A0ABR6VC30_9PSED|nr:MULTISPECIES: LysR family transcriptional regulator [Pseudomonas]AGZ33569.1 LysR family transcriptional regulator [Pseudomonas sp. VLB120]MBC3477698.1 LysR family transcriptional regulator [Pseudomonas taiwanensis]MBC3493002.1 LysR family transcriptional regulator [Pseudomonas taiwanensis]MDT8925920.1 LysR family transcriptional regulator [Pseudomonas taiwanensis]WEZ89406.1 LysR family transcriptional regulator [Pseudomonas sp. NyZ480]
MHFDLIDLNLFQHVLECGSITAGAQRSHLSLPAASARIRAMESSLGIALLARNRRGVQPTPAGQALLQHARMIGQQVERLQFDLAQYAQGQQGQVRLLCNTAALTEYLPELLAGYLAEQPGVSIDVQELPSLRIVQSITQGMADLGIISTAVPSDHLQTLPFREDPLVLVMSPDHPLASLEDVSFNASLAHGHVGLDASSALALHLEEQALRQGRRMQVRVRAEGFDGLIRMVAGGAGIGIVPLASVRRWEATLALHWRRLQEDWAKRQLLLCARDFAALPGYTAGLVSSLLHAKGDKRPLTQPM